MLRGKVCFQLMNARIKIVRKNHEERHSSRGQRQLQSPGLKILRVSKRKLQLSLHHRNLNPRNKIMKLCKKYLLKKKTMIDILWRLWSRSGWLGFPRRSSSYDVMVSINVQVISSVGDRIQDVLKVENIKSVELEWKQTNAVFACY